MLYASRDSITSSFLILKAFPSFSYCTDGSLCSLLKSSSEHGHSCLVTGLMEKMFNISQLSM